MLRFTPVKVVHCLVPLSNNSSRQLLLAVLPSWNYSIYDSWCKAYTRLLGHQLLKEGKWAGRKCACIAVTYWRKGKNGKSNSFSMEVWMMMSKLRCCYPVILYKTFILEGKIAAGVPFNLLSQICMLLHTCPADLEPDDNSRPSLSTLFLIKEV